MSGPAWRKSSYSHTTECVEVARVSEPDWRAVPRGLGISYRQLDYWTRLGWLHPEPLRLNAAGNGTGDARRWPEYELVIAARMGRLVALGLTPEAAHRVARAGREAEARHALRA